MNVKGLGAGTRAAQGSGMPDVPIQPQQTLATLALTIPSAPRVFHRHRLDFCCHGRVSLDAACRDRGLDLDRVVAELREAAVGHVGAHERWDLRPLAELVAHLLADYHAPQRIEVARLAELAGKVERVHADHPDCPHGLADHLVHVGRSLELHMRKEEQVLFPLILAGRSRAAFGPVQVMEHEHQEHVDELRATRLLAHDFEPPTGACTSWRALYLGLEQFERELMEHISLENNTLFARALQK